MPLIQVKLIENVFSPAQKREIIQRLTDTMVEIEGENMRPVTWVTIDEVCERRVGNRRQHRHKRRLARDPGRDPGLAVMSRFACAHGAAGRVGRAIPPR